MPEQSIEKGNHTYHVKTVKVPAGGWTFEIVHIVRTEGVATAKLHSSGIAYESEEAAFENGLLVAGDLAGERKD